MGGGIMEQDISAAGTPKPASRRVRIAYVEPGFQSRNPGCPPEFTFTFEIPMTLSKEEAIRRALEEWDFCIKHSGVSWRRVITAVSVDPGN